MRHIKASLLAFFLLGVLLTGCEKTRPAETSGEDSSGFLTETPGTTARELYGPNVRQLTLGNKSEYEGGSPYIICSVGEFCEYIDGYYKPTGEYGDAVEAIKSYSYGFDGFSAGSYTNYEGGSEQLVDLMKKEDLKKAYDGSFFTDRVLVVCAYYVFDGKPPHMVTIVSEIETDEVYISYMYVGQPSSTTDLYYCVLKFIELDREYIEGKTVNNPDLSSVINSYQKEWSKIVSEYMPEGTGGQSDCIMGDDENYALFLETYGDVFDYIEPWVLKPER